MTKSPVENKKLLWDTFLKLPTGWSPAPVGDVMQRSGLNSFTDVTFFGTVLSHGSDDLKCCVIHRVWLQVDSPISNRQDDLFIKLQLSGSRNVHLVDPEGFLPANSEPLVDLYPDQQRLMSRHRHGKDDKWTLSMMSNNTLCWKVQDPVPIGPVKFEFCLDLMKSIRRTQKVLVRCYLEVE